MNEKKVRGAKKQAQRLARLGKRAERIEKSEVEREFDAAFGDLKRERDEAVTEARQQMESEIEDARKSFNGARLIAEEKLESKRAKLYKRMFGNKEKAA